MADGVEYWIFGDQLRLTLLHNQHTELLKFQTKLELER